jgi:hypothetical protein
LKFADQLMEGDETEQPDFSSEGFGNLVTVTAYITRTALPVHYSFAAPMLSPIWWTPEHDFMMLCHFVEIGYNKSSIFFTPPPAYFNNINALVYPTSEWLDLRKRLIIHEVLQFIPENLTLGLDQIGDRHAFRARQPALWNRTFLTLYERKQILRLLYLNGIPHLLPHRWENFRHVCGKDHISIEMFTSFITTIYDRLPTSDDNLTFLWFPPLRRREFSNQLTFIRQVREAISHRDLTRIEWIPWDCGPGFWNTACDLALIKTIMKHGFTSSIRLILDTVVYFPFEVQKQIARFVRFIRSRLGVETFTGRPFTFLKHHTLAIFSDIPKLRARVNLVLLERCPFRDMRSTISSTTPAPWTVDDSIFPKQLPRIEPPVELAISENSFNQFFLGAGDCALSDRSPSHFPIINRDTVFYVAISEGTMSSTERDRLTLYGLVINPQYDQRSKGPPPPPLPQSQLQLPSRALPLGSSSSMMLPQCAPLPSIPRPTIRYQPPVQRPPPPPPMPVPHQHPKLPAPPPQQQLKKPSQQQRPKPPSTAPMLSTATVLSIAPVPSAAPMLSTAPVGEDLF